MNQGTFSDYHDRNRDDGAIGNKYDPCHGFAWNGINKCGVFHDNDLDEIRYGSKYGSRLTNN